MGERDNARSEHNYVIMRCALADTMEQHFMVSESMQYSYPAYMHCHNSNNNNTKIIHHYGEQQDQRSSREV